MSGNPDEIRARAEAKFQKQQKAAEEGVKVRAEHEAQAQGVEANTARLKSLRLAKEAADQEAAVKQPETSSKTKSAPTKKKPSS
jgi:hypothetical protein